MNYKYAYNSVAASENVPAAIDSIKSETGHTLDITQYNTWNELIDAFYAGKKVQAIVINHSMINMISQDYENFEKDIKIIKHTVTKKRLNLIPPISTLKRILLSYMYQVYQVMMVLIQSF